MDSAMIYGPAGYRHEHHREAAMDDKSPYILGMREAAITNCMYCNGNAVGYFTAQGPNEAGNWTHTSRPTVFQSPPQEVLCKSSAIWSLIAWRKTGLKALEIEVVK